METNATLYNGVPLAKCELLARLRNNPVIPDFDFVPRSAAELCAHIAAAIEAARCEPADLYEKNLGDDEELVEHAPVPSPRPRKRSLASTLRAARKAGASRAVVDGVVIVLSPDAAMPETDSNEWDAVLPGGDHGPH